jgi:hypothetical protein
MDASADGVSRRRRPRDLIKGRPNCAKCGGYLTARRFKETRHGRRRRYFTCTNPECSLAGDYRLHFEDEGGQWRYDPVRPGPQPEHFGVDRCPECDTQGTLRSRGWFPRTRAYDRRLRRVECAECGATFRLLSHGNLEKAPAPGFQRKHALPLCKTHGTTMERGASHRTAAGVRWYTWRCPRMRCTERVRLDADGRPISTTQRPDRPVTLRALECGMLGCRSVRADQVDGRKRYCMEHSRLSYFQRWRMNKQRRAALAHAMDSNGKPPGDTAASLRNEFGAWLARELMVRGEDYKSSARRADLPPKTVYNWVAGIARPNATDPKWRIFAERLQIDRAGLLVSIVLLENRPMPAGAAVVSNNTLS